MLFFKKKRSLCAVCNGRAMPLSETPDEAFASGMLGVGYAIEPRDGQICSPVDGVVESVAEAKHAYTLQSAEGLDVLVHIGVDTVGLGGEGFFPLVQAGDRVAAGEPIARADMELLRARGLCTYTVVLISNPERVEGLAFQYGEVKAAAPVVHFHLSGKE